MNLNFNNRMDQAKGGIYFEPDFAFGISQAAGFGLPYWYEGLQTHLKLEGRPTFEIFEKCLANRHPVTGCLLTPRMNTTRLKKGKTVANRRLDHELTPGCPKTVSLMALVANDTRIITSFDVAAYQLLSLAARFAQTRVRRDQKNEVRLTQHLIGTLFPHVLSRAGDPHLHGHLVFLNLTRDPVEKRLKALEFSLVLDHSELLARWIAAKMMKDLLSFGYELEVKGSTYEIAGISAEVISKFSKRTIAIEEAVAEKEKATGEKLSHAARKYTGLSLRNEKQVENWECLRRGWRSEAADELDVLDTLREQAERRSQAPTRSNPLKAAQAALDTGIFLLCERKVGVTNEEIVLQCLRSNVGLWTGDNIETAIKLSQQSRKIIPFPGASKWSTPKTVQRLAHVIETINAAKNSSLSLVSLYDNASSTLPAVQALVASSDPMSLISTSCSSDSREALRAVVTHLRKICPLRYLVPAAVKAAQRFHFSEVLNSIKESDMKEVPVCVVAQAEKLTLPELERLTLIAAEGSARIILMASRCALENSDDFRPLVVINRRSWLHCIPLTPPSRHKSVQWIPSKVKTFASLATQLIRRDKDNVTLLRGNGNQMDPIAASAFALLFQCKDPTDLFIAVDDPDRRDTLNQAIHSRFASTQPSQVISLFSSIARPLEPVVGEILVTPKQTRHFAAGDILRVADVNSANIIVKHKDGLFKTVTRKVYSKLLPVRFSDLALHPGTHLELTEPYPPLRLKAGKIIRVNSIAADGSIVADSGGVLPPWFRFFRLGYCHLINNRLRSKAKAAMVVLSQRPTKVSKEAIRKLANDTRDNLKIVAMSAKALPQSIVEKLRPNLAAVPPHLAEMSMETDNGAPSPERKETLPTMAETIVKTPPATPKKISTEPSGLLMAPQQPQQPRQPRREQQSTIEIS